MRELIENPRLELIRHDVTQPLYVEVDQIYNLACPASPPHCQYNPVKTAKTSAQGSINMLGLAKRVHARILQASTSEVYGDPQVHPQPESCRGCVNPVGICACCDKGKRMTETVFFDYHHQHNLDIRVVLVFNTYGPNMNSNDGRVVSNFIAQALKNEDNTIYGDGKQTRSFRYVDDLVEGMVRMMDGQNGFTGPVNLGNPGEFTMLELTNKIIELTESRSQIIHKTLPSNDPAQHRPVIELAKKSWTGSRKSRWRKGRKGR